MRYLVWTKVDLKTDLPFKHHPRLIVDSNSTYCDHQLVQKLPNLSKLTKMSKIDDFEQNRQFWQFPYKVINLYTGLYTNPVHTKLTKSRIHEFEMSELTKSRFCQFRHFHHNLINLYTENSYNWGISELTKKSISTKIVKIDDFEQNWRFRQFRHFLHKLINLYTGLYTNPVPSKWHCSQKTEISDFEWSRHLANTKESPPKLPTFSKSLKSQNWTQKLKISDQKFSQHVNFCRWFSWLTWNP